MIRDLAKDEFQRTGDSRLRHTRVNRYHLIRKFPRSRQAILHLGGIYCLFSMLILLSIGGCSPKNQGSGATETLTTETEPSVETPAEPTMPQETTGPASVICTQSSTHIHSGRTIVSISVSDGSTKTLVDLGDGYSVGEFALNGSGDLIATSAGYTDLRFYDHTGTLIRKIDIDKTSLSKYGGGSWIVGTLSWHPSGRRLLISLGKMLHPGSYNNILAVYDYDTGKFKILGQADHHKSGSASDSGGTYSPDGKSIAFGRGPEIYIANDELGDLRHISKKFVTITENSLGIAMAQFSTPFTWSRDGRYILCCYRGGGGLVVSPEGEVVYRVPDIGAGACWTDDGKIIANFSSSHGDPNLYIVDPASGDRSVLAENHGANQLAYGYLKPVATGKGGLFVTSDPRGQKIYINGEISGEITPFMFELEAGPYTVRSQGLDGSFTREQAVVVRAGQKISVTLE